MKSLFCLIVIWPLLLVDPLQMSHRLIIWNVGQGSWATYFEGGLCLHFDSGGDRRPRLQLLKFCREHQHYLSHLDWDHISFLKTLMRQGPLCRVGSPDEPQRRRKQKIYEKLLECPSPSTLVTEIQAPQALQKANDRSRIFILKDWALIPGDSTKRAEKYWAKHIKSKVEVLLLGHHGSNTSSWNVLLQKLPDLKLAVASARKRKYGHPHHKVLQRLQSFGVPVISTEDWGNIIIETPVYGLNGT